MGHKMGTQQGYNVWKYLATTFLLLSFGYSAPAPKESRRGGGSPSSTSDSRISKLSVTSHIMLRYAQTEVESLVKNPSGYAREVNFSMFLPDSAFISFFSMTIDDDEQVAQVMA